MHPANEVPREYHQYLDNPICKLPDSFKDERGEIIPMVDTEMKSSVIITSKSGSVRANHYHKTDWHYCYVVTGSIDYYWRKVGSKEKPLKIRVKTGETFFTPPMLEHAMVFPEDCIFICLGRNPRDQKSYEADIVRVQVVPFQN